MTDTRSPTKLDLHVKQLMLGYPMLFETRLSALCQLYLTLGGGYEWSRDGVLRERGISTRKKPLTEIDLSSIDDGAARLRVHYDEMIADLDPNDEDDAKFIAHYEQWWKEILARDDAKREEWRARGANIDVLAFTPDHTTRFRYYAEEEVGKLWGTKPPEGMIYGGHYEEAQHVYHYIKGSVPGILGRMPKKVERSYFDGAIEVLDAVIRSTTPDQTLVTEGGETRNAVRALGEIRADMLTRHTLI